MTAFILVLILVLSVIVFAIWRDYRIRTGLRLGWLSFFLETDRNETEGKRGIVRVTENNK